MKTSIFERNTVRYDSLSFGIKYGCFLFVNGEKKCLISWEASGGGGHSIFDKKREQLYNEYSIADKG